MTRPVLFKPSGKRIAEAFSSKAHSYEQNAPIQKELLLRLVPRIQKESPNGLWLDLGCGTGILEQLLFDHEIKRIISADFAFNSLLQLLKKDLTGVSVLLADIQNLPFGTCTFEGIVMSSVLQWLKDTSAAINSVSSLLIPGGRFVFSAFIKGSFCELTQLRLERGLTSPARFPGKDYLLNAISQNAMDIIEFEDFSTVDYFPSAVQLLRNLSSIGSTAVHGQRLTKRELLKLCEDYEDKFGNERGIPLSYKAITGTAVKRISR